MRLLLPLSVLLVAFTLPFCPQRCYSQVAARRGPIPDQARRAQIAPAVDPPPSRGLGESTAYWHSIIWNPQNWLVAVGILTLLVLAWQAIISRKAAQAAAEGIRLQLSRERARVRLRVTDFQWQPRPLDMDVEMGLNRVLCTPHNTGPTGGYVETFGGCLTIESTTNVQADFSRCVKHSVDRQLAPGSSSVESFAVFMHPDAVTEASLAEVRAGKKFVHFYGFLEYRDIFDRQWKHTMHVYWLMRWGLVFDKQITSWWEKAGPSGDNGDVEIRPSRALWWWPHRNGSR